ncbi:hypothetical protein PIB30_084029 [Stylosanthes scabra]|uniref:Uncharacterized protein n=1 Tax=Stylosanthes scabra TaxID=79078 RepID=A0ABU6RSU8_9FABA|nr:hypothetical protein [Stylosanthes scabra]
MGPKKPGRARPNDPTPTLIKEKHSKQQLPSKQHGSTLGSWLVRKRQRPASLPSSPEDKHGGAGGKGKEATNHVCTGAKVFDSVSLARKGEILPPSTPVARVLAQSTTELSLSSEKKEGMVGLQTNAVTSVGSNRNRGVSSTNPSSSTATINGQGVLTMHPPLPGSCVYDNGVSSNGLEQTKN